MLFDGLWNKQLLKYTIMIKILSQTTEWSIQFYNPVEYSAELATDDKSPLAPDIQRIDNKTSATTPIFLGSSNPLELVGRSCDQTGSG